MDDSTRNTILNCTASLIFSCGDLPDVNNDVHRVGQEFQGELCLQKGMDLLHMVRDVFTDVLKLHINKEQTRHNKQTYS